MKFKSGMRRKPIVYEKDLVQHWKEQKIFERSVEEKPKDNSYIFYDGPPFITGVPHHGTLLSSVVKDAVPRYWTMKGKRVERVWGWDCHGLPAEVFTEKKLGIQDRRDIGSKVSLEEYITTCRNNMVQTGSLWEDTIDRIGRWVDFKGAYKTMDKDYMESVWWAFKQLYEKGKIYEGKKVLLYCTRDATPISKAEVAMDNSYQDVTDPSVYVKFKLVDEDAYLLAWTTTPWTLPANTAVAVNEDIQYAEVEINGDRLILAESLLARVLADEKHRPLEFKLNRILSGKDLIGKRYIPLFEDRGSKAHKIWHADYVSVEDGTGIVHLAPTYGEEDYALAREKGFPAVENIDDSGFYTEGEWKGRNAWEVNKLIAKTLHESGVVWKIDYIRHSYPHCHRCGTKLMYRAHPSWFMDIEGQRSEMLDENQNINWFPSHIKHGRFEKTVQSAPDWNLSRDRFWATPMPVWKGKDNNGKVHIKVIGSYEELKALSGKELEDYHRPWIDEVIFTIDGITYKRIDKVLDCWFESGSMPFAQFHYPFENIDKFEQNFPGDFIAEYVGQVRAWFYYLHAINIGLFGTHAFKNVIVTGTLAGNDGRKMSKSFGNYTDPNELMDSFSADALRFLLLGSPLLNGEDFALIDKDVADVSRKLSMIWNMFDFFTLYAEVDGWEWKGERNEVGQSDNPLDQWVLSRVHQLIHEVDKSMQLYDLPGAIKPILPFIEDASNWYVRRSRRRFWKSDNDTDKEEAYRTLHYVLVRLAKVMAPFTPFLSEELYCQLTGGESVHLEIWPEAGHVNEIVIEQMRRTREIINEGLSQRARLNLRVRQPLANATYFGTLLASEYEDIIKEELNVKKVTCGSHPEKQQQGQEAEAPVAVLDTKISPALRREGLVRETIRYIQNARKQAGLQVDDRINLSLSGGTRELQRAINEHRDTIMAETLASSLNESSVKEYELRANIEGTDLLVALRKV